MKKIVLILLVVGFLASCENVLVPGTGQAEERFLGDIPTSDSGE